MAGSSVWAGRLQQCVPLAHGFRQILVQVAQKARVRTRKDQRGRAAGVRFAEELDQRLGAFDRRRQHPDRVVARIEDITRARQFG
jgi:hypothetical protein